MGRLRVGIVGAGKRVGYLYAPLVRLLRDDLELAGICSRTLGSARAVAEPLNVPAFDDVRALVDTTRPDLLIASVSRPANGAVGRALAQLRLPLLLETPIADEVAVADGIIAACQEANVPVEVAEQYYRRPMERVKAEIIRAGHFGSVSLAYNDFLGHAYHGISMIRSYIGFDVRPTRIVAVERTYPVQSHPSSASGRDVDSEQWEHAVISFANGATGVFDWTSIGYGSAIRWQRSTRFLATRGMALGDELTLLSPDDKRATRVRIERRIHNIGGMEVLAEIVAHTDPPIHWTNPFARYYLDDEMIAEASCLMSLVDAIRIGKPPEYGPEKARTDQAIYVAMKQSAAQDGTPVELIN
jgi:predicted dehydrogenase